MLIRLCSAGRARQDYEKDEINLCTFIIDSEQKKYNGYNSGVIGLFRLLKILSVPKVDARFNI